MVLEKKAFSLFSCLGIACLLAVQFIVFLEGRGLGVVSFSLQGTAAGFCGGIIFGGVLFSAGLPRLFGFFCSLGFTLLSAVLWGGAILQQSAILSYGACFWGGTMLPPLLRFFFANSSSPGFHLGSAFALGDFFWLFLYVFPMSGELLQVILLLLQLVGGGVAAVCIAQGNLLQDAVGIKKNPDRLTFASLGYLSLIAFIFFLFNAFIDIPFYRIHNPVFPIPAQVHLYLWIVYPVAGILIDKYGADMRFLLLCFGGVIVAPMFVAITEGTIVYWIIYSMELACRGMAQLYFILVFAQIGKKFSRFGLIASIPYVAMFVAFQCVYMFVERFPGTSHVAFWCWFLTSAFGYISSRVQYALTLAGILKKPLPKDDNAQEDDDGLHVAVVNENSYCRTDSVAAFALKYGISLRERDVLWLILEGRNTSEICDRLHISENTLKTHIRQILRKTETRNRNALLVLFFNEEQRGNDAVAELGAF